MPAKYITVRGVEQYYARAEYSFEGKRQCINLGRFDTWEEARMSEIRFRLSELEDQYLELKAKIFPTCSWIYDLNPDIHCLLREGHTPFASYPYHLPSASMIPPWKTVAWPRTDPESR